MWLTSASFYICFWKFLLVIWINLKEDIQQSYILNLKKSLCFSFLIKCYLFPVYILGRPWEQRRKRLRHAFCSAALATVRDRRHSLLCLSWGGILAVNVLLDVFSVKDIQALWASSPLVKTQIGFLRLLKFSHELAAKYIKPNQIPVLKAVSDIWSTVIRERKHWLKLQTKK